MAGNAHLVLPAKRDGEGLCDGPGGSRVRPGVRRLLRLLDARQAGPARLFRAARHMTAGGSDK